MGLSKEKENSLFVYLDQTSYFMDTKPASNNLLYNISHNNPWKKCSHACNTFCDHIESVCLWQEKKI